MLLIKIFLMILAVSIPIHVGYLLAKEKFESNHSLKFETLQKFTLQDHRISIRRRERIYILLFISYILMYAGGFI